MWSAGQMMFNKYLLLTPPKTNIRNSNELAALLRNCNPKSAVIRGEGIYDVLDHATATCGFGGKLALDILIGAARAVALGVAALDHKALNDTVEDQSVIEALGDQLFEVCYGNGCHVGTKLHNDGAEIFDLNGDNVGFLVHKLYLIQVFVAGNEEREAQKQRKCQTKNFFHGIFSFCVCLMLLF